MFLYIVIERRKYNRPGFKSPWTDTELYRIPVRPEVLKGLAEPLDGLRIMVGSLVNRHPGVYGVFPFRDPSTTTNLVKVVMTPASTPVDEESLVEVLAVAFGPRDPSPRRPSHGRGRPRRPTSLMAPTVTTPTTTTTTRMTRSPRRAATTTT